MILSLRHKFVFIKGFKVAGTSIEIALSLLCGPQDIVTPLLAADERMRIDMGGSSRNYGAGAAFEEAYMALVATSPLSKLRRVKPPRAVFYNHMPLVEVVDRYPGSLDGFRIVCVERSPYAKVLSWLNMVLSVDSYSRGGEMRADRSRLAARFDRAAESGKLNAVRNIDLYRAPDGTITAEILRYETLAIDFNAFVASLGLPPPALPHAKQGLMSNDIDPLSVLRRDQIDTINDVYADEFELFGYPTI